MNGHSHFEHLRHSSNSSFPFCEYCRMLLQLHSSRHRGSATCSTYAYRLFSKTNHLCKPSFGTKFRWRTWAIDQRSHLYLMLHSAAPVQSINFRFAYLAWTKCIQYKWLFGRDFQIKKSNLLIFSAVVWIAWFSLYSRCEWTVTAGINALHKNVFVVNSVVIEQCYAIWWGLTWNR